jgi:hypothetical protein
MNSKSFLAVISMWLSGCQMRSHCVALAWNRIMRKSILILIVALAPVADLGAQNTRSVFISAQCEGKSSSAVLTSFKKAIQTSQKFRVVPTMEDEGRFGVVLAVYIVCAERPDFTAVATTYGQGRCAAANSCGVMVEGVSLKLAVCESSAAANCGRALFAAFDDYVSKPAAPRPHSP